MLYIGALAVIIAAFMIWKEYVFYLGGELACCRAFLRALRDYRDRVRCYLDSPAAWARAYEDEILSECGFLASVAEGTEISEAYLRARRFLSPDDGTDAILRECFGRLGDGYLETELAVLDFAISELAKAEAQRSPEVQNKQRAAGAFIGACVSGLIIMII